MKNIKKIITCMLALIFLSSASYATQNSVFLFVSLSMPDNVLSQYLVQAKQYHIPVVIRGLYTEKSDSSTDNTIGSFNDTANRVLFLLKNESKIGLTKANNQNAIDLKKSMGGVLINPLLFRNFNIHVVPALVITNDISCVNDNHKKYSDRKCKANSFDVVYGNIPIQKQLEIVTEKSSSEIRVNLAKSYLNQFQSKVFKNA